MHVPSEDSAEDFEGFVNGTRIDEELKFATSQYTAMSDEVARAKMVTGLMKTTACGHPPTRF